MAVEVVHGLAAVGLTVDHEAGTAFGAALFRREFLGLKEEAPQEGLVPTLQFHDVLHMPFGDDKKMNRRLGCNIVKGQKLVIFVDLFGWNFTSRYFTENTIPHGRILPRDGRLFPVPKVAFQQFRLNRLEPSRNVQEQAVPVLIIEVNNRASAFTFFSIFFTLFSVLSKQDRW
jgi:hypothetical protein